MNTVTSLRLLFVVCFAALQTLLLHLAASLLLVALGIGPAFSWPALMLTALLAALVVWRWEPADAREAFVRPPTLLACALTVLFAAKVHLGGGWNPLAGWLVLWPLASGSPDTLFLLAALVVSLIAWWRGMALPDSDHGDVVRSLQNGVLLLVVLTIVVTPLAAVNLGAPPWGALFAIEGVTAIACGLAALTLARVEALDSVTPAARRRLVRSGLLTTGGLVGVGVLVLALVSSAATEIMRRLIFVLATGIAFLLSPLVEALYRLINFMRTLGSGGAELSPTASPAPQASEPAAAVDQYGEQLFQLLVNLLSLLLYLLPLLILVLAIIMMQRRRRQATDASGAQHESLWSWRSFAGDLRGMLSGLAARRPGGLRDALARLRGDDPARRIRRRYVEALLLGEQAKQQRSASQTPLEFQPRLSSVAPEAGADVATLTESYDRARYAPQTIQPADADQADAAWESIKRSPKDTN